MNLIVLLLSLVLAGPNLSVALVKKTVKVHWQGTPGNQQDWITVVPAGTPDDVWGNWVYLKGKTSGTFVVQDLAPGQYEARLYLDWPKGKFNVVQRGALPVGSGTGVEGIAGGGQVVRRAGQPAGLDHHRAGGDARQGVGAVDVPEGKNFGNLRRADTGAGQV
jgi:hypothetical protein